VEFPFTWGGGKEWRRKCFWDSVTLKMLVFEATKEVEVLEKVLVEKD